MGSSTPSLAAEATKAALAKRTLQVWDLGRNAGRLLYNQTLARVNGCSVGYAQPTFPSPPPPPPSLVPFIRSMTLIQQKILERSRLMTAKVGGLTSKR